MTEFTLTLTEADLAALNVAIGEMPYRLAAPLVQKINRQIAEQQQAEPPTAEAVPQD